MSDADPEYGFQNDDDAPAHDPSDAFISRDGDAERQIVYTDAGTLGEVGVIQMAYGDVEKYFGDAGEVEQADAGSVAEIIREHVQDPDYNAFARQKFYGTGGDYEARGDGVFLTAEIVQNEMLPMVPQLLLTAIMDASGMDVTVDVDQQGGATVEFNDEEEEGN